MSRLVSLDHNKFDKENQHTRIEFQDSPKLSLKNQNKACDSSAAAWLNSVVNNESNIDVLGSLYQEFIALVKKYPESHKEKPKFTAIREYIIDSLSNSPRYINDHRLLEIWLKDPLLSQNYEKVFEKMMARGICKHWSSLYITFSDCSQKAGRLDKAKYFCQVGLKNKAEPPKILLNRIEEVEKMINIGLKTKNETTLKSENFKRPTTSPISGSTSKKFNTLSNDMYGPYVPYLEISHTEADHHKNSKYFKPFTANHDDNAYFRKKSNERTMSICFMKGGIVDESYEELRARTYSSKKLVDKKPEPFFASPKNTPNRNGVRLGSSQPVQSIISTPNISNRQSSARQSSSSKNRIQALRSNNNTPRASTSDRIQISSQPNSTPKGSAPNRIPTSSPAFPFNTSSFELSQERQSGRTFISPDVPTSSQMSNITPHSQHSEFSEINHARIFSEPPIPMDLEMPSFVSNIDGELDITGISAISGFDPNSTIGFTTISLHQTPLRVRNASLRGQVATPYPDPESHSQYNESQSEMTLSQEQTLQLGSIVSELPVAPRKHDSHCSRFNRDASPDTTLAVYQDP